MGFDAGMLGSIIGGASNLTSSFLSFGASIYATNHMQGPVADNYNYTIAVPEQKQDAADYQIVLVIAIILVVLLIAVFLMFKYL